MPADFQVTIRIRILLVNGRVAFSTARAGGRQLATRLPWGGVAIGFQGLGALGGSGSEHSFCDFWCLEPFSGF